MYLIILVLDNTDQTQPLLDAWDQAGAPGVTVLSSTGLGRIRARIGLHEDVPLLPSLEDFLHDEENLHRTLIAIVRGREVVDAVVQATQAILGDLNRPNTGILAVLPVLEAYGLDRHSHE